MVARVLLITSDSSLRDSIREVLLTVHGCELVVVEKVGEAKNVLDRPELSIVFLHLAGCEDREILEFTQRAFGRPAPISVVAISDTYIAANAVKLLQQGMADYLSRPLDLRRLAMLADMLTWRARQPVVRELKKGLDPARCDLNCGDQFGHIIEQVRAVAPLSTSILLTGETGTGKTRLARLIHELSPRRDKAFVSVNCGGLSPSLVESELFGHVKSAFTGADSDRAGKFATAGEGTLMLDDIDSLPLVTQPKLLRAVDERTYEPVGSDRSFPVRARLIAASNRDLHDEIVAGRFRSDLYYRLNVVAIYLPPLRDRREVIPALINEFIAEFSDLHGRNIPTLLPDAQRVLSEYDWPGNIRELRNVIERVVALSTRPMIGVSDLPATILSIGAAAIRPAPVGGDTASTLTQFKAEAESTAILNALASNNYNRSRAARALGISRVTLYKKLQKYGITL